MILPAYVGAQSGSGPGSSGPGSGTVGGSGISGSFKNPLSVSGVNTITDFIRILLENIVIPIGAVVSVFFVIYAGFLFVMAQGKPDGIQRAKQALLNALIGSLIILGSWAISLAIKGTVDQLRQGLP